MTIDRACQKPTLETDYYQVVEGIIKELHDKNYFLAMQVRDLENDRDYWKRMYEATQRIELTESMVVDRELGLVK